MAKPPARTEVFAVGGPVQASGGVYLERPADQELLEVCLKSEYAYVLTPRQMGKSSLMFHTREKLTERSVKSAIVDLTEIGGSVNAEQWYFGILTVIEGRIDLELGLNDWWETHNKLGPAQRFTLFFEQVLLAQVKEPIVIFLDEIDTTLSAGVHTYSDDFFAAIRALYTARARTPELKRLSFVLIGVATPNELINDPKRTPFNIGRSVDLTDFTLEQAKPLSAGFGLAEREAVTALGHVLKWTGGHPYLTQRLCRLIAESGQTAWGEKNVDELVQTTYFSEQGGKDNNLVFVRNMLTDRAPDRDLVLSTYRDIWRGDHVPDEERSIVKSHLKLSGVVRNEQNMLQVRNSIYKTVFDQNFLDQYQSEDSARRNLAAANERTELERLKREQEQHINRDRQRSWLMWASGATLASLTAFGVYSLFQNYQQTVARASQTAILATAKLETRYDQALLIAVVANQIGDTESTRNTLKSSIDASSSALKAVMYGHSNIVSSVAFSPVEKILASGSYDKTIRFWDTASHQPIGKPLEGHTDTIWSVVFSPDGQTLASASFDKTVRLWDVSSRKEIATLKGHTDAVRGVAFSPDGKLLASASEDNTIRLWSASSFKAIAKLEGHSDGVYSVAFNQRSKLLASASKDNTVRLWDTLSRKQIATLKGHTRIVSSVQFSPDGQILASGSYDKTVRLWDVSSRKSVATLAGHTGDVDSVTFGSQGKTLGSSGMDKTVRLWDVQKPKTDGTVLKGHSGIVLSVAFSPDGNTLASGSFDQSVRLWNANSSAPATDKLDSKGLQDRACSIVGRNLTQAEWKEFFGNLSYQKSCPEFPAGQ